MRKATRSTVLPLLGQELTLRRVGRLAQGILVLGYAASAGTIDWTLARVVLLSGMVDPLPLFPEWAQVALRSLPFAGLVDLPFRIYTGHIAIGGLGPVFLIVCLQVWRIGVRHYRSTGS